MCKTTNGVKSYTALVHHCQYHIVQQKDSNITQIINRTIVHNLEEGSILTIKSDFQLAIKNFTCNISAESFDTNATLNTHI